MVTDIAALPVGIPAGTHTLNADLRVPQHPAGLVIFAHGSGHSRSSSQAQLVGEYLEGRGFATLQVDLLTMGEEASDQRSGCYHLDIGFLSDRVCMVLAWVRRQPALRHLPIGIFAASTTAAAALVSAAAHPTQVDAVISRGGRPDLAEDALARVHAPTLMLVGSLDTHVIDLNRQVISRMPCATRLTVVQGASHQFAEPGTLAHAAELTADWLERFVAPVAMRA